MKRDGKKVGLEKKVEKEKEVRSFKYTSICSIPGMCSPSAYSNCYKLSTYQLRYKFERARDSAASQSLPVVTHHCAGCPSICAILAIVEGHHQLSSLHLLYHIGSLFFR